MLKCITEYIIGLYYFLTATPKNYSISKTIRNNNVVGFVCAVINLGGGCCLLTTLQLKTRKRNGTVDDYNVLE